jgi:hypothetical protein
MQKICFLLFNFRKKKQKSLIYEKNWEKEQNLNVTHLEKFY